MTATADIEQDDPRAARPDGTAEPSATVAGGGDHAEPPAGDAVAVEGPAPDTADTLREATLTAWVFRHGAAPRRVRPDDLPALVADDANIAWVDLGAYAAPDLRALAQRLDLPAAGIDAALAPWQRPQLDVYQGQLHVSATVAHLEEADSHARVHARQLDLFVRPNALVSAHRHPLPFADRILARARQSTELPRLDAAYLLYVVLDELLQHTERLSEEQEDIVAELEERAVGDPGATFLTDLLRLKRAVFALGRLVDQHREIFAAFLRPEFRLVAEQEIEPYFRDLQGRLEHLLGRLADAKASVDGAFDLYVSHVAHRTNEVMRLLTVVSTLLLPATVILGLFGTTFQGVPLYSRLAFVVMLALILLVTGSIAVAFWRRGWLAPRRD